MRTKLREVVGGVRINLGTVKADDEDVRTHTKTIRIRNVGKEKGGNAGRLKAGKRARVKTGIHINVSTRDIRIRGGGESTSDEIDSIVMTGNT
jgi:hypothetical protein